MSTKQQNGTERIADTIRKAVRQARSETADTPDPEPQKRLNWPLDCTIGPGLEGAYACESKVGFVNGTKGQLVYCGYDIFDLCEKSTFEEVSYLLLYGRLPSASQYEAFKAAMIKCRHLPNTQRLMMGFPIEEMNPMSALRLGSNLMRQRLTWRDSEVARPSTEEAIASDEDSIPMETEATGEKHAIYEFRRRKRSRPEGAEKKADDASGIHSCVHLISGMATIAAGIARMREDKLPVEPDTNLGHAANFLYMMTGRRPTPREERIMDVALILHADHGMNASTFASMVVASTMSDIYFSIGAGIAALNGPLHGGANEQVIRMLERIGGPGNVDVWFEKAMKRKQKITGFGHRVYKTYDPRARILGPLAKQLALEDIEAMRIYQTAQTLEKKVVSTLGKDKGIFPNVDFYSGLVYRSMGIPPEMFTPIFAVSRVAGWTARVLEYLKNNRIFRPRAAYVGDFGKRYVSVGRREGKKKL